MAGTVSGNGAQTAVHLSGLTDGTVTATIVASDTAGNTATVASYTSVKYTTADVGGDLAVTIVDGDGYINNSEKSAVAFSVAGLDNDATAVVTFSEVSRA